MKIKGNKKVKGKRKNKKLSTNNDGPITNLLRANTLLSDYHLKIGTVIYACLFTALYFFCHRKNWYGVFVVILAFVSCVVFLVSPSPNNDHILKWKSGVFF